MDHQDRSLKSQLKQANKLMSRATIILGPDELAAGVVKVRDMQQHSERDLNLNATIEYLRGCAETVNLDVDAFLAH